MIKRLTGFSTLGTWASKLHEKTGTNNNDQKLTNSTWKREKKKNDIHRRESGGKWSQRRINDLWRYSLKKLSEGSWRIEGFDFNCSTNFPSSATWFTSIVLRLSSSPSSRLSKEKLRAVMRTNPEAPPYKRTVGITQSTAIRCVSAYRIGLFRLCSLREKKRSSLRKSRINVAERNRTFCIVAVNRSNRFCTCQVVNRSFFCNFLVFALN